MTHGDRHVHAWRARAQPCHLQKDQNASSPPEIMGCPICFERVKKEDRLGLPCGHSFHPKCISLWLGNSVRGDRRPTCPCCRAPVEEIDASRLAWECDHCGGCDPAMGALVCVGPLCFSDGAHTWSAGSKCYRCAGILPVLAPDHIDSLFAALPDYTCAGCDKIQALFKYVAA